MLGLQSASKEYAGKGFSMRLWKVDTVKLEIREVEGDGWPHMDSEGAQCFINTHFKREADAIEWLINHVDIQLQYSGRRVKDMQENLRLAQVAASDAAVKYAAVMARYKAPANKMDMPPSGRPNPGRVFVMNGDSTGIGVSIGMDMASNEFTGVISGTSSDDGAGSIPVCEECNTRHLPGQNTLCSQ